MQQRTRELAPVLPRLVEAAEQALRAAEATLADAKMAGAGQTIEMDGEAWEVFQSSEHAHVRIRRNGKDRDLSFEEDNAFWTWALVETLRHIGARIEEVLELVHMSIQPYKVPTTGETIPMLHFAPSMPIPSVCWWQAPSSSTCSTECFRVSARTRVVHL